jgi:hypothetical protein
MGMMATLAGKHATAARINIPAWGCWYADVSLDGAHKLSGPVDLVVADLTLKGTILSGGPTLDDSRSHYRVVAGGGGWGRVIDQKSYADDAGVKVATVLADAATAAGEKFDATTAPSSMRTGPGYVRRKDVAARSLELTSPSAWYVGEDGVTRLGARPGGVFKGKFTRTGRDRSARSLSIASDSIAPLLPGVTVDDLVAVDVEHDLSPSGLRTTLWSNLASTPSRRLSAWRKLFDQLDADRTFRGIYEYRVVTLDGKRANVQPVRVSTGMPALERVPIHSLAGCTPTLALGSRILVAFVDASVARPIVLPFDDLEDVGFVPTKFTVESSGDIANTVSGLFKVNSASDFAALAAKVDAAFSAVVAWATSHVHPTGVGPSGPAAPVLSSQPSTACTKLKTD